MKMIKDIQGNIAEVFSVAMSIFPAWLWEVSNAKTGVLIRRFKTQESLNKWMNKHTEWSNNTNGKMSKMS